MSKSITAEELKTITDQQKELGQVLNQIGQLEWRQYHGVKSPFSFFLCVFQ